MNNYWKKKELKVKKKKTRKQYLKKKRITKQNKITKITKKHSLPVRGWRRVSMSFSGFRFVCLFLSVCFCLFVCLFVCLSVFLFFFLLVFYCYSLHLSGSVLNYYFISAFLSLFDQIVFVQSFVFSSVFVCFFFVLTF